MFFYIKRIIYFTCSKRLILVSLKVFHLIMNKLAE